jgi:drug/metabolite transporter (DMT)-like permease
MTIAGLTLLPWSLRSFRNLKETKDLLPLAIVGLCGNFFPAFLFTYAETGLSSGYTGMLNSFTPIFAIIIGFTFFKNRLNTYQIIGLIIGTIGITSLSLSGEESDLQGSFLHIGAVILATLCYAISMNTIKFKLSHLKGLEITSMAFSLVLIPGIILTLVTDAATVFSTSEHALTGLTYITILSVVGTAFAVFIFSVLIARSSLLFSSSVTYLIPIFAALIGLMFHEKLNVMQFISMGIVLVGIYVANVLGRKKTA